MRYIDRWEQLYCSLEVGVFDLYEVFSSTDVHINLSNRSVTIRPASESGELRGQLQEGNERVSLQKIEIRGVGGRHAFENQILPLLRCSSGSLDAIFEYEGGGFSCLHVRNGKVTRKDTSFEDAARLLYSNRFQIGG